MAPVLALWGRSDVVKPDSQPRDGMPVEQGCKPPGLGSGAVKIEVQTGPMWAHPVAGRGRLRDSDGRGIRAWTGRAGHRARRLV
jgi:hypothetical protein